VGNGWPQLPRNCHSDVAEVDVADGSLELGPVDAEVVAPVSRDDLTAIRSGERSAGTR
jgi:hypothetical protein